MSQTSQTVNLVDLEVFYPYPPERVWQVLTDRQTLAAWMMENNFEPRLGHKFQFHSQPLPGLKTTIQCEVVDLEEPTRLVYTWQETPAAERSLVVWTLTAVASGTQLRLKHYQQRYASAVAASQSGMAVAKPNTEETAGCYRYSEWYGESLSPTSALERLIGQLNSQHKTLVASGISEETTLTLWQPFTWDYLLNQTLPQVLLQADVFDKSHASFN